MREGEVREGEGEGRWMTSDSNLVFPECNLMALIQKASSSFEGVTVMMWEDTMASSISQSCWAIFLLFSCW